MRAKTHDELIKEGVLEEEGVEEERNAKGEVVRKWRILRKKDSGAVIKELIWDKEEEEAKRRLQKEREASRELAQRLYEKLRNLPPEKLLDYLLRKQLGLCVKHYEEGVDCPDSNISTQSK